MSLLKLTVAALTVNLNLIVALAPLRLIPGWLAFCSKRTVIISAYLLTS